MFTQTIFLINFYVTKPQIGLDETYSECRCQELKLVPVIRIFGSTPEGQKACVHIHNVFPYLLIKMTRNLQTKSEFDKYLYDLANNIDLVLNAALCIRDPIYSQHVYKIEPVMTKSMYGYHQKDSIFLKISMINPELIRKVSELLLAGSIMGESFQPYESHVPYNLQFLMDHNLFGMNVVHLDKVKFRREPIDLYETLTSKSVTSESSFTGSGVLWNVSTMNEEDLLDPSIERQSTCDLELDASGDSILNSHMDKEGFMLNPGMSALWEEEKKRREYLGISEPMEKPDLEERPNMLEVANELEFKNKLISYLENRFQETYPFKQREGSSSSETDKETIVNPNFAQEQPTQANLADDSILGILDELHNDSDLDNSMLHATQLNSEEAEALVQDNLDLTQVQARDIDSDEEDANVSVELENTQFINELNKSGSSSNSSCNNSINDPNTYLVDKDDTTRTESAVFSSKSSQFTLVEELINSSEDEKVYERQLENKAKEPYLSQNSNIASLTHNCTYFESLVETNIKNTECSHSLSMYQSKCLKCDHSSELKDSLDYMAFTSPVKTETTQPKKWSEILTVDNSPTINNDSQIAEQTINNSPEMNTIIDETLDQTTIMELEAIEEAEKKSECLVEVVEEQNLSRVQSRRISQVSQSFSMLSDSTFYWSDSDNSERDEHFLTSEYKSELKRKRALYDETFANEKESDLFSAAADDEEGQSSGDSLVGFESVERELNEDEGWFCPCIDPPLQSEINQSFIVNNEAIVQFYKARNKKFKMILNVPKLKSKYDEFDILPEEQYQSEGDDSELRWFTPAIPLPSVRRVKQKIKNKDKVIERQKEKRLKKLEKLISTQPANSQRSDNNNSEINQTEQTLLDQTTSILKQPIEQKSKKRKRKSVRFNETIFMENENKPNDGPPEKGHFQVEDYFLKPEDPIDNIQIAKKPMLIKSSYPSSLDDTISLTSRTTDEALSFDPDETSRQSFYEYDSILLPKTAKFIDFLSVSSQDMSIIQEKDNDKSNETKEGKKDKKIVGTDKTKSETSTAHLTLMSLELHANTRGNLHPNPEIDSIGFIIYTIYNQKPTNKCLFDESLFETHMLVYDQTKRSLATRRYLGLNTVGFLANRFKTIEYVYKEEDLFERMIKIMRVFNPDILVGFELQKMSWCYLCRRAMTLNLSEFCNLISRLPSRKRESIMRINIDKKKVMSGPSGSGKQTGQEFVAIPQDLVIAGRVVLNLWRIFKSEISLNIYTFENCCYHILKERVPKYSFSDLSSWFSHRSDLHRWKTIEYYLYRAVANFKLMSSLDLVGRTTEFAKVYGIEFYHVISRGSQYRVESMMLRIAHKLNYVALSANQKQKAQMRAAECIPLTLEPESKFYTNPMAVLDFQSLYPTVIIGFNICYTTCLGRVEQIGKEGCFKFGCSSLFIPDDVIKSLDLMKDIYVAPNGVAFVKPHVRKGVLPIMLEDILRTRFMVKASMKLHKDENLYKIFDSRQMSLKLIANVTFGYTAANFSGRMPSVEVGDSIVRVARQALENSIKYIHENFQSFRGIVKYGDTDSLFVEFEDMPKQEAFEISYKIVDQISSFFPKPMKLKFEKIYHPSILLAKKRYIGNMYETPEQSEAVIDAKGVEIVRRDGCTIASKILERCCKIMFEFKDTNKVKEYVLKQCIKLVNGKVNPKDFIIAKEYRGRDNYSNAKSIASCQIANRAIAKDPMTEPLVSERVPYLIIYGSPNRPLYELVRSPEDLIKNSELKLNYEYYVMKQILPPIDRIMVLMGINAFEWVKGISFKPKIFQYTNEINQNTAAVPGTSLSKANPVSLSNYIYSTDCILCGEKRSPNKLADKIRNRLCDKCANIDQTSLVKLRLNFQKAERKLMNLIKVCQLCTHNGSYNMGLKNECITMDCQNNFLLLNAKQEYQKTNYVRDIFEEFF